MGFALSVLYTIATAFAFCVAFDFWRSKDGVLRLILIQLFATIGLRYFAFLLANIFTCPLDVRLAISCVAIPLEIVAFVRLWQYVRWNR